MIEWVQNIFTDYYREMKGLNWGQLYDKYHQKNYNPQEVSEKIKKLYGDPYIKNVKGIFEYVLGGSTDTKLLNVRVFDDAIKRSVYMLQTKAAEANNKSNCPDCAIGHDVNKNKIWNFNEMEADHVSA